MKTKMTFDELVEFEKKNSLWELKFLEYPVWIHCREPLIGGIFSTRKINIPSLKEIVISCYKTIIFLFRQSNYKKVFFLMERAELLEIYDVEKETQKILFLNKEQESIYKGTDYISSDFFNIFRFLSRKVAYIIFRKQYLKITRYLDKIGYAKELNQYIQIGMGDALFLKTLSYVLSNKNDKIYSGSVIPIGEKFLNRLNSFEVQHGVIYSTHIGYIGLPKVKNGLILYSENYKKVLKSSGYNGLLLLNAYKKDFFSRKSNRLYEIVIYTQPTQVMQEGIKHFFEKINPQNCFIQKHPKDYFDYGVPLGTYVIATTPIEVGYPIAYTSTIIENFTLYGRDCYIYDVQLNPDLKDFLQIYQNNQNSKMIIMDSLEDIYMEIQKNIEVNKRMGK